MVIVITFKPSPCARGWRASALDKQPGLVRPPRWSSPGGLDLLLPTAGAEHVGAAVPYQIYGFLEA